MNKTIVAIAVAVFTVALAACAYAQVAEWVGGASCTTSDPATPKIGAAQTIKVSANIVSTVTVRLSATKVDWKVTSSGTYKDPSINISIKNPNGHDVVMNVAGAADLKNSNGKSIDTFYGIAKNWMGLNPMPQGGVSTVTDYIAMCPPNLEPTYQTAASFNGSHQLSPNYTSTLWNKIAVTDAMPTGTYSNQFTVTFSEQL